MSDRSRRWLGAALLVGLGAAQITIWFATVPADGGTTAYATRAMWLFGAQLAGVIVAWRRDDRVTLAIIIIVGLGLRAAALTWSPDLSTDLYRYLWDGQVQDSGRSPYAAPPSDPALVDLRDDEIWPAINRPDAITVYPPGSQLAFLALVRAGGTHTGHIRLAAGAAELAALLLLTLALRRRGLPIGRLAIYAWSPLIVAEMWVSGHVDALVLALVVGAVGTAERERWGWTGVLIGAAAALKLYPMLLLAAVPRERWRVSGGAAVAVVAAGYLPHVVASGVGVAGFLPDYVGVAEDFNLGTRGFVQGGLELMGVPFARHASMVLCAVVFVAVALRIARWGEADFVRRAGAVALAFVLLLPTAVHPWYAAWLVPFLVIVPSAAGVWIVGLLPLSYLKYGTPGDVMPAWVPMVEWLPAYLLLALAWRRRARAAADR